MLARLPLTILLGAGAGALALWLSLDSGPAERQAALPLPLPAGGNAVFGPGKWVAPQQDDAPSLVADAGLSRTEEGDLLIDPALLSFFNQHFVEHAGPAAWKQTERDLRGRLSGHALDQALELAREYQGYVGDYDALLAAQNLSGTADLVRLRGWARQRHLLRQRDFGNAVALAWFDNDEANLGTALDELEQRASGAVPEEAVTDARYGPSAEDRRRTAEAHAAGLRQILNDAVRSFGSMAPQK
ncbi:MAG TPA: hypothetical protein VF798_05685 [Burkholderiaceae bacterium]